MKFNNVKDSGSFHIRASNHQSQYAKLEIIASWWLIFFFCLLSFLLWFSWKLTSSHRSERNTYNITAILLGNVLWGFHFTLHVHERSEFFCCFWNFTIIISSMCSRQNYNLVVFMTHLCLFTTSRFSRWRYFSKCIANILESKREFCWITYLCNALKCGMMTNQKTNFKYVYNVV